MQRLILAIATGFGLGRLPIASGTFGALLGLPLALAFTALYGHIYWQIGIALALTLLAVPICDAAEKILGKKDDGRIVADEFLTLPIVVIAQPIMPMLRAGAVKQGLLILLAAFVISRITDILKPSPARQSQRLPGGWGIVLDDFFSSIYAMIITWVAADMINKYL